jgi:hypothetical protein
VHKQNLHFVQLMIMLCCLMCRPYSHKYHTAARMCLELDANLSTYNRQQRLQAQQAIRQELNSRTTAPPDGVGLLTANYPTFAGKVCWPTASALGLRPPELMVHFGNLWLGAPTRICWSRVVQPERTRRPSLYPAAICDFQVAWVMGISARSTIMSRYTFLLVEQKAVHSWRLVLLCSQVAA